MSEPNEAVERLNPDIDKFIEDLGDRAKQPLIYSDLGLRADLERAEEWGEAGWRKVRDLEAERDILLRKAAAFDAMVERHFDVRESYAEGKFLAWVGTHIKGKGATPLECVECAVKGLEGR